MEETTETPTEETQAEESQLNSAAGDEADSVATGNSQDTQVNADSLSLAEINEITGMSYKDKDTALKSIKDMKSQAGKAADLEGKLKVAAAAGDDAKYADLQEQLNQTKLEVFYSQNPEVNKELVETIAKANGITPQEAINTDLYKNTVAAPAKRTVADTNNRVAQPKSDEFNPKDHAGDADAMAKYVHEQFIAK